MRIYLCFCVSIHLSNYIVSNTCMYSHCFSLTFMKLSNKPTTPTPIPLQVNNLASDPWFGADPICQAVLRFRPHISSELVLSPHIPSHLKKGRVAAGGFGCTERERFRVSICRNVAILCLSDSLISGIPQNPTPPPLALQYIETR